MTILSELGSLEIPSKAKNILNPLQLQKKASSITHTKGFREKQAFFNGLCA